MLHNLQGLRFEVSGMGLEDKFIIVTFNNILSLNFLFKREYVNFNFYEKNQRLFNLHVFSAGSVACKLIGNKYKRHQDADTACNKYQQYCFHLC